MNLLRDNEMSVLMSTVMEMGLTPGKGQSLACSLSNQTRLASSSFAVTALRSMPIGKYPHCPFRLVDTDPRRG